MEAARSTARLKHREARNKSPWCFVASTFNRTSDEWTTEGVGVVETLSEAVFAVVPLAAVTLADESTTTSIAPSTTPSTALVVASWEGVVEVDDGSVAVVASRASPCSDAFDPALGLPAVGLSLVGIRIV